MGVAISWANKMEQAQCDNLITSFSTIQSQMISLLTFPHVFDYFPMTVCSIELSILHMIVLSSRMILINYPYGLASGKCKLMKLNIYVSRYCSRSQNPIGSTYMLNNNHTLVNSDQHHYLGVILHKNVSWSPTLNLLLPKCN